MLIRKFETSVSSKLEPGQWKALQEVSADREKLGCDDGR